MAQDINFSKTPDRTANRNYNETPQNDQENKQHHKEKGNKVYELLLVSHNQQKQ